MGKQFNLTASDAHSLGAYRADPAGKPKGGMIVVQEIFGVNHHIRAVCDRLAGEGYVAVAPAVFDRFVRLGDRSKVRGAGIGLSVVRQLVEAQGGRVSVEGDAEGGATFVVLLPAAVGAEVPV